DGERLLERRPFGLGLAEATPRGREIDPVRPFARLAPAGGFEMKRGRWRVPPREGIRPEPVAGHRLLVVDRQNRFEMTPRLVAKSRSARALPFGQVLLNAA